MFRVITLLAVMWWSEEEREVGKERDGRGG
jgi:hypothetical protein